MRLAVESKLSRHAARRHMISLDYPDTDVYKQIDQVTYWEIYGMLRKATSVEVEEAVFSKVCDGVASVLIMSAEPALDRTVRREVEGYGFQGGV